jgi:CheY-like chemotaxis protein
MTETPMQPFSVLITDDDPGCRETLRDIIEPEGYRTLFAGSGEEALDIVRNESVHLVLTDYRLPRLSGLDVLKLVRQMHPQLPSILVTAEASAEIVRQAFQARAFSVIPKPVSKHVVLYTVVRAIVRQYGPVPVSKPKGDATSESGPAE